VRESQRQQQQQQQQQQQHQHQAGRPPLPCGVFSVQSVESRVRVRFALLCWLKAFVPVRFFACVGGVLCVVQTATEDK